MGFVRTEDIIEATLSLVAERIVFTGTPPQKKFLWYYADADTEKYIASFDRDLVDRSSQLVDSQPVDRIDPKVTSIRMEASSHPDGGWEIWLPSLEEAVEDLAALGEIAKIIRLGWAISLTEGEILHLLQTEQEIAREGWNSIVLPLGNAPEAITYFSRSYGEWGVIAEELYSRTLQNACYRVASTESEAEAIYSILASIESE